ncbi:MAG: carboxypeptidase-like regulatory domain-containing protein, partial [Chitinophagaceae bacterium]
MPAKGNEQILQFHSSRSFPVPFIHFLNHLMMKKLLGTILFTFSVLTNFAQEKQFLITGRVLDAQTNEPIEMATVKCDNQIIAANSQGVFSLKKPFGKGKYKLEVLHIGYTQKLIIFDVIDRNIDVEIKLDKVVLHLEQLEVSSIKASNDAPFPKTNLTKGDIAKVNQGQDLPFILNQTPSVVVNSDAGNGVGYTGIRIRGNDATRVNVTLNGIPYNDA